MYSKEIYNKVKMKIAISIVNEEDIVMKKSKLNIVKKLAITSCALLSTAGVVFATTQIINKFGPNSSDGAQKAVDNGYISYSKENSIVDSFMLDNYNFYITFNEDRLGMSLNDIFQNYERSDVGERVKEYLIIKNENDEEVFSNINTAYGLSEKDGKIFYTATAKEFPISKKLYIDFAGRKEILDVPENMQNDIIQYKLKSISDENWKFESASLSNTAFKIFLINCNDIAWNDNECIETSNGTRYYPAQRSDGDGGISIEEGGVVKYYNTFNLTKFDATDVLIVHLFKNNGDEVFIELER